jgi:NADPH:quinone reductase-like Zn-dependent oxidoreductase
MTIQLATAAGIHVVAIAGAKNFELTKRCGAVEVFDYKDPNLVSKVVDAARESGHEFIGIVDAISTDETYPNDLAILAELGGKYLVCTHPPPVGVPTTVKAGMVFAVNDAATPVWNEICDVRVVVWETLVSSATYHHWKGAGIYPRGPGESKSWC